MIEMPAQINCGFCDSSEFGAAEISPERAVTKFEIEYYLSDGNIAFCDDLRYNIRKDWIQIAVPGQVRHTVLPFSTFYLKFEADGALAARLTQACGYFRAVHTDKIKTLFKKLILSNENDMMYYSYLFELLSYILGDAELPEFHGETTYQTISRAKRFIEQSLADGISLGDIAAHVNLSQSYFHTVFTAAVGCSPHEYLVKCRIDEAKKMLWDSENQMKEIAVSCGFGCQQYFNKVFKRQTGMTPLEYKKSLRRDYLL